MLIGQDKRNLSIVRVFRSLATLAFLPPSFAVAHAAEAVAKGSELWVNGVRVARFTAPVGVVTPANRAELAASRLASGSTASAKGPYVIVDGTAVYAVAVGDAKAAGTTPEALASTWAKSLNAALHIKPLEVEDEFVNLPVGGLRTLRLKGTEAGRATLKTDNASVATIGRTIKGVVVHAVGIGHATIAIQGPTAMESVDITVKPSAAALPRVLDVEVTGAPSVGSTVMGAVEGALKTRLVGLPGVKWKLGPIHSRSLESGQALDVPVKVTAEAPGAFPTVGVVDIRVKNVPIARIADESLWYSNDPETVRAPGNLFAASVKKGEAARLLYHHMNGTVNTMFLRVQAVNESDVPARVALTPGDGTPDKNPVKAGLDAAGQYMKGFVSGSAEIVTIPPHGSMPICLRRLAQYETGSGLCSIRLIDGPDSLLVRTDAFPPFQLDDRWIAALFSSTPWREVGSNPMTDYDRAPMEASLHIYPAPYKTETVDYEVGGRFGFVRLGQRPIQRQDQGGGLDGNFGVLYTIKTKLENPRARATDVEVVFEASAGYAGGLFVINGRTVTIPQLSPKMEGQVMRIRLAPGQTQSFDIITLPLSGSAYPATLTFRPVMDGLRASR